MKVSKNCSVRGLWDELNQGLFPWIDDNIGELDAAHRLFMAVCEAVINPREFDYAKWKGNGRPPASRLKIFKAFGLYRSFHSQRQRSWCLCGWRNA